MLGALLEQAVAGGWYEPAFIVSVLAVDSGTWLIEADQETSRHSRNGRAPVPFSSGASDDSSVQKADLVDHSEYLQPLDDPPRLLRLSPPATVPWRASLG